jgi:FdhD protein
VQKGEAAVEIRRYEKQGIRAFDDRVVVEEPLEVWLNGTQYYVTMRLPGEEMELALGYCFTEGIIDSVSDVDLIRYCGEDAGNRVDIIVNDRKLARRGATLKPRLLPAYSSCGVCGKEMVSDIDKHLVHRADSFRMPVSQIDRAIREVESHQLVFRETGGTHATGIFDEEYRLISFAEDVGRHNALDKAMGKLVAENRMERGMIVVATSRLSYEMVQKTGRTSAQVLVGVSIATSLAIELSERIGLTLVGFARKGSGNVYTGEQRIVET